MRERGWAGPHKEGETLHQPTHLQDLARMCFGEAGGEFNPKRGLHPWEGRKPATAKAVQRLRGEDKGRERGWGRVEPHPGGARGVDLNIED